jgi:Ca2+-binding RTX toxin-like protein
VHGDADDDLLVTSAGGNVITGDAGNDVIAPLSGFGSASGGSGADTIVTPVAGSRSWTINGGAGADTIRATAGSDTVTGGDGNDVIDVSGDLGTPDSVSCGNGRYDTVYADADDVIGDDCETVSDLSPTLTAVDDARADAAAFRAAMPDIPAF